ncbi:MAG TPA: ABC transporter permease [Bryobacteraceae bacterium]|nr:ABC transporter permease [Bryobacteraceae bacterium]
MSLLSDIRYAIRFLRRAPVPTAVALLSIALSVGAAAVVFAAIKAVLLDPLPFARPDELVLLRSEFPQVQQQAQGDWVIWNDSQEVSRRTRTLAAVATYHNAVFDLAGDPHSTPLALYGLRVSANLFDVLGVKPMLGRNILPPEERRGHADVMILSYGLWMRRFHGDRSVVGRTVMINGRPCLIVGVMPHGFNFPLRRAAAHTPSPYVEFWAAPLNVPSNPGAGMGVVARLGSGVSLAQARQDLASISAALTHDFPELNRDRVLQLNRLGDRAVGTSGRGLWMLMTAATLFMLIGCANVANLLLARGITRRREIAVRLALGARRSRIIRQLLTESCVLAVAGGAGGFLLALAAWKILPALAPVSIPRLASAHADGAVLAFALAVAAINGILFGLAPALRAGLEGGFGSRGAAAARHDRLRSALVAAEVALSVLLVVTGGRMLDSFARLIATDPGFQSGPVLASVVLPAIERYPDPAQRALFYQRILEAVRALPGVESAGVVDALPFSGENHGGYVSAGNSADSPRLISEIDVVGGDYLQSLGIRLLAGRWFRDEDMRAGGGALVNLAVARRLWPGRKAVGQRLCVACTPEHPDNWKRVIGVVSSASHAALDEPEKGNVYLAAGAMRSAVFLTVRTRRPAGEMALAIRRAIAALDPNQPVLLSATLRELISDSVAGRRFIMLLLAVTAVLALMLSAAGVYGVISYTTSLRTPEIGIRMAVGAAPRHVFALVFRQAFATAGIGLILGLGTALAAGRALRTVLTGLDPGHAAPIWIAVAIVTATAALACWIPARRATRVDPVAAIRHD